MSFVFTGAPAAGGSGANVNLDNTYEALGWNSDGTPTTVSSTTSNVLGSGVSLGTTANAWAGFFLTAFQAGSNRYQIDLSFDGGSTWPVQGVHVEPSNNSFQAPVRIPVNVASGASVQARLRASAGASSIKVALVGIVRNASSPPCFTSMTALNLDTTNTRAATSGTQTTLSATAWTQIIASTAATYGGLLVMYGGGTVTPVTAQMASALLGLGASGSEVETYRDAVWISAASSSLAHAVGHVIEKAIPSGTRIAAAVRAATPGTDSVGIGVYGLVA